MNFFQKVWLKVNYLNYEHFLRFLGRGNRLPGKLWDEQYAQGTWNYLDNEEEAEHYEVIIDFLKECGTEKYWDVGCGNGTLLRYALKSSIGKEAYKGFDLSVEAIKNAGKRFPGVSFNCLDFERNALNEKADVVVFNESLYYFSRPLNVLKNTFQRNVSQGGRVIISMCDYKGHDYLWQKISSNYRVVREKDVSNSKNQLWKVMLIELI